MLLMQFSEITSEPATDKEFLKIANKLKKIYKLKNIDETALTAYQCTKNIINKKIKGSIVECGTYRGQKITIFLETLKILGVNNRDIYIVDTFKGMTEPGQNDFQMISNKRMTKGDMFASLETVKKNIYKTKYPRKRMHFIKMDVRKKTLKNFIPGKIALLRLDVDFYDGTLSILNSLYSKVNKGGNLIHDDYGHWKGHYDACNDFYKKNKISPALIRTCRKERVEIKY